MGYYTRWALMRQWSKHSADGSLTGRGMEQLMVVDSDRDPSNYLRNGQPARDVPAAPFCESQAIPKVNGGDGGAGLRGGRGVEVAAQPSAGLAPHRGWDRAEWGNPAVAAARLKLDTHYEHQIGKQRDCVPSCETLDVNHATHGVCHGKYQPGNMLLRSRFALCLRGDIPTSPRPYDAMR